MTTKQIRAIAAAGKTERDIEDWIAALPDFVLENGPLKKNAAAVLVAALTQDWPLPEGFVRRRQLELRAADELERRRADRAAAAAAIVAPPPAEPQDPAAARAAIARARSAAGFGAS